MSFANFKRDKSSAPTNDLETQSDANKNVLFIAKKLIQFTSNIESIKRLTNLLGTKEDSTKLRNDLSGFINVCDGIKREVSINLNDLDIKTDNDKFNKSKLIQQSAILTKSYKTVVQNYHARIQSAGKPIDEDLTTLRYVVNEETPLASSTNDTNDYNSLQVQMQAPPQGISDHELKYHEDLIANRNEAISSINQGVQDINKIFKDLDFIVVQQGEQIGNIEQNINSFANENQLASIELSKANEYQRKKGKWSCIILLILLVFFVVLLLLVAS